jgi:hypothetical protein
MNTRFTPATSTSLVQRIEAALSGSDLHASEIAGLIEAAEAAEARLENLIAQLNILLTAVTAAEKAAEKAKPQDMNARVFASLKAGAPF